MESAGLELSDLAIETPWCLVRRSLFWIRFQASPLQRVLMPFWAISRPLKGSRVLLHPTVKAVSSQHDQRKVDFSSHPGLVVLEWASLPASDDNKRTRRIQMNMSFLGFVLKTRHFSYLCLIFFQSSQSFFHHSFTACQTKLKDPCVPFYKL